MNWKWSIISQISASIILIGCSVIEPNCHGPFNIYRSEFIKPIGTSIPRTDGIYVSEDGLHAYFLYSNGRVMAYPVIVFGGRFWASPDSAMTWIANASNRYNIRRGGWGDMEIVGDSLIMQRFNYNVNSLCRRSVFDESASIMNDRSIVLQSVYYHRIDTLMLTEDKVLKFYPSTFKPDSSKAWFANKRWYKKKLHPSRQ